MKELPPELRSDADKLLETDLKLVGEAYWNSPLKKKMDKILSGIFAVPAAFTTLVSATSVYLEDGKNPFFVHNRYHPKFGEVPVTKIRSMYVGAEKDHASIVNGMTMKEFKTTVADPRITKVGKLLRSSSLDEAPQVFDVLIHERYSFVGIRPMSLYNFKNEIYPNCDIEPYREFVAWLNKGTPYGATGLAVVLGRHYLETEERLQMDNLYSQKASAAADFRIAVATLITPFKFPGK